MVQFRREDGVSNIIEYLCVLPLCLIGICFVLMVGYYLHQGAVLEAAAYRSAMTVQHIYNDPNALQIMDFGTDGTEQAGQRLKANLSEVDLERDPYRYFNNNYRSGEISTLVTQKMETIINAATLTPVKALYVEQPQVSYDGISGLIRKEAVVRVTQPFRLPWVFRLVGLPAQAELKAEVKAPVIAQTEFIRNAMFAEDLIEQLSQTSETVNQLTQSIQIAFSKINDFFQSS